MTREEAVQYVSFQMDDAHDRREAKPSHPRVSRATRIVRLHKLTIRLLMIISPRQKNDVV
jgi:hypothetical protein